MENRKSKINGIEIAYFICSRQSDCQTGHLVPHKEKQRNKETNCITVEKQIKLE